MTTHDFLERLEPLADHPLRWLPGAEPVPGGYHVTEIKATTVHAMDCGGASASWDETVLQILPPASASDEPPMTVAKFLAIFGRVAAGVPVRDGAYVRVEYGEVGAPAVGYLVDTVEVGDDGVTVHLLAPTVACKGADPTVSDVPVLRERPAAAAATASCCGTPLAVANGACC